MIVGFDHVVILAGALTEAMHQYESLGFVVEHGGIHSAWGTENALIPLTGGAYLELLAVRDPNRAKHHRLWQRPNGGMREPGEYGGYALATTLLDAELVRMQRAGLFFHAPEAGSRERPDTQVVRWRNAHAHEAGLPFLIEDLTPKTLRIAPAARGLGARARLAEVEVATADLQTLASLYKKLLALPGSMSGDCIHLAAPWGTIVLRRPPTDDPARPRLEVRGPGVSSIVLEVEGWEEVTGPLRSTLPLAERAVVALDQLTGTHIMLRLSGGSNQSTT